MNKIDIIGKTHLDVIHYDVTDSEELKLTYYYKFDTNYKLIQEFRVSVTLRGNSLKAFDIGFDSMESALSFYSKISIHSNMEFLKSLAYKKFDKIYELAIDECEKRKVNSVISLNSINIYCINEFIKLVFNSFNE